MFYGRVNNMIHLQVSQIRSDRAMNHRSARVKCCTQREADIVPRNVQQLVLVLALGGKK